MMTWLRWFCHFFELAFMEHPGWSVGLAITIAVVVMYLSTLFVILSLNARPGERSCAGLLCFTKDLITHHTCAMLYQLEHACYMDADANSDGRFTTAEEAAFGECSKALFAKFDSIHCPCLNKVTEQPFISLRKHKLFVACVKHYAEK